MRGSRLPIQTPDKSKPTGRYRTTYPGAEAYLPRQANPSIAILQQAANECRGCDLYKNATQTVFGEGAKQANVMLIGEQPGDQEDLQGHPFVGPAGALLTRALSEAGIDRGALFITNIVKHFKWMASPRGKRRVHSRPTKSQVAACRPWLDAELLTIKPEVIVILGATAGQNLLGSKFRVSRQRGKWLSDTPFTMKVMATVHPSSILCAPDEVERRRQYAAFVADLRVVAAAIQ